MWGATGRSGWRFSPTGHFNPRTPCGVRRGEQPVQQTAYQFQSTHPVWGATHRFEDWGRAQFISIHAPRVGCDLDNWYFVGGADDFNPRTPCGVRPCSNTILVFLSFISIHAPRVGCDRPEQEQEETMTDFNPRTPCGVRLCLTLQVGRPLTFQSTHPVWGATAVPKSLQPCAQISIHAPRVGCDAQGVPLHSILHHFNPRTPCGVRLTAFEALGYNAQISIHAPRVGCDAAKIQSGIASIFISIHAPRVGCDVLPSAVEALTALFQSTHPVWGATGRQNANWTAFNISIHAPRVGCDVSDLLCSAFVQYISIHAPRVGCDHANAPAAIP